MQVTINPHRPPSTPRRRRVRRWVMGIVLGAVCLISLGFVGAVLFALGNLG